MDIKTKLKQIPEEPGVYLMKDADAAVIYIGKAIHLKRRVASYFRKTDNPKTAALTSRIADIEYIVTDSEMEALILESNLIKKHKPKFNIRLKDDKRYPYIAVTAKDDYPRVMLTRRTGIRGARYFGPYTDAAAAHAVVNMTNIVFKLRMCSKELPFKPGMRPCINFQIKRCSGPCVGEVSAAEYGELVSSALRFLEGDIAPVLSDMNAAMQKYSQAQNYEKAARMRDIIIDINRMSAEQKVAVSKGQDIDYLNVGIYGAEALLVLFEFRKGILLGRKINVFDNAELSEPRDIVRSFILDYYERAEIPSCIITPYSVQDKNVIEQFLTERASKRVVIARPVTAEDQGIADMIKKNIEAIAADREASKFYQDKDKAAAELAQLLGLPKPPDEIVCFDISNLQGTNAVASMVTFRGGVPDKSNYRRFRIRGHEGPNDPAMIHEAVGRRIQHLVNENIPMPDIMLIDGGPTQLTRAMEAAANFDVGLKIISLAEHYEDIYYSPTEPSIKLPDTSPARKLLQRVRDEAHRFAITYHKKLRAKEFTSSQLDEIDGVSKKTRVRLLKAFDSIDAIKRATKDELAAVEGIGHKTAQAVYARFHEQGD